MHDLHLETWLREEAAPFVGWDFSHLAGRWHEEQPPWSFEELARGALTAARSAVDLGTGGGERLARLAEAFPPTMIATEGYRPNVEVARRRLAPLGVSVVEYESKELIRGPLPFERDSISVVLDRHESYDPTEVARVLEPGGIFLTQQVDSRNLGDLRERFGVRPSTDVTVQRFSSDLEGAGLQVERAEEWWGVSLFADLGAVVYYLKSIPWSVPGFSVATHEPALRSLQLQVDHGETLSFRAGRFLIVARKPM